MTEKLLNRYVSFLAQEGLAHTSIKSYLSAIRQLQIEQGLPDPFQTPMPRLEQVIKGIKVRQGKDGRRPRRKLPITPDILRKIRAPWEARKEEAEIIMLWAACTTCFFGFMRSGEVAIPSRNSFDSSYHLAWEDLAVNSREKPTFMQLTLKGSKTDPFRQGVKITIGHTGDKLCPVAAVMAYAAIRGNSLGPLFKLPSGVPMTRPYFVGKVREVLSNLGLTAQSYGGHSFRVGAATTAVMVRIEDSLIQTLGRWRSSAYLLYIRIPKDKLQHMSYKLVAEKS